MKKMYNKLFALLWLLFLPTICHSQVSKIDGGMCGETLFWELYSDSTLHIIGSGKMEDYKKSRKSPFNKPNDAKRIATINLVRFYGRLGKNAFVDCTNLRGLVLPQGRTIECDREAFGEGTRLTTIECVNQSYGIDDYRVCLSQLPKREMYNWIEKMVDANNVKVIVVSNAHITPPLKEFRPFQDITTYNNLKWETYDNGDYYGQMSNGKREGIGKYSWNDGDWYIGEWKNGERTGIGEFHFSSGTVHIGKYASGISDGRGMRIYKNGNIYVGDLKDGNRNGSGTFYWKQDKDNLWRVYHGDFKDGRFHGHGIVVQRDGAIKMGVWANGDYMGFPESITFEEYLDFPEALPLRYIEQQHVEKGVNQWQQKGEFERTDEWKVRVTEESRNTKAEQIYTEMVNRYILNAAKKSRLNLSLGLYDADHETFLVIDSVFGEMLVSMTGKVGARYFKDNWRRVIAIPTYYYNGETSLIDVQGIQFFLDGKEVARYSKDAKLNYRIVNIKYDFDPIALASKGGSRPDVQTIDTMTIELKADVDLNVPKTLTRSKNVYAFIVANENYTEPSVPNVPYARNDGRVFKQYCQDRLGVDPAHITLYENATLNTMFKCVARMKDASKANAGNIKIIFYYAGHGFPDPNDKGALLLPVDGDSKIPETGYSLDRLYEEFGTIEAESIVCFLDACFSGATRDGKTIVGNDRGVAIKPKQSSPKQGKMIVFSSSKDGQTAGVYESKQHGMFTYFLLKYMQDHKGSIRLGNMFAEIESKVKNSSFNVNKSMQEPQVIKSPLMNDSWMNVSL